MKRPKKLKNLKKPTEWRVLTRSPISFLASRRVNNKYVNAIYCLRMMYN